MSRPSGVVHVAAVGERESGTLAALRIGPGCPTSATDRFALDVARGRADAIVTTGRILRAEPSLTHGLSPAVDAWRREVLGKAHAPYVAVLSRGDDLPVDHPVFQRGRVLLGVPVGAGSAARRALAGRSVEIVELADPSLVSWIAELQRRGAESVCVEAGPSTACSLYEEPIRVDELLLSIYEERHVRPEIDAGAFPDPAVVRARLGLQASEVSYREPSGLWRFRRYRRADAPL